MTESLQGTSRGGGMPVCVIMLCCRHRFDALALNGRYALE